MPSEVRLDAPCPPDQSQKACPQHRKDGVPLHRPVQTTPGGQRLPPPHPLTKEQVLHRADHAPETPGAEGSFLLPCDQMVWVPRKCD